MSGRFNGAIEVASYRAWADEVPRFKFPSSRSTGDTMLERCSSTTAAEVKQQLLNCSHQWHCMRWQNVAQTGHTCHVLEIQGGPVEARALHLSDVEALPRL